jgi:DNA adenine methylase
VKVNDNRSYLVPWIIEKFPPNYRELTYVEPFLGAGNVLLNKDISVEEVANEYDPMLLKVWQAVRDEPKLFVSKLKKVSYKESIFKRYQNKKENDYVNQAVTEFALRQMSKSGLKKHYLPKESKAKEHCWANLFEKVPQIQERMKNVFLINKNPIDVVRAFGGENTLIYCECPTTFDGFMDENKHMELGEALLASRGKVVVTGVNCSMYKRIFTGWGRKGVPGKPKESAWFNF